MRYRTLGNTELCVSEVGFGCWGIGGDHGGAIAYGKTDDVVSRRALEVAFDSGITFYDTADFYGYGHSEELLGHAFSHRRDKVIIASKGGMLNAAGDQDFSSAHIKQAIDGSLTRLKTDYIDLYQWHSPPATQLGQFDETFELIDSYVTAGKIRYTGFSARSPQDALIAMDLHGFAAIQANFNLADQRAIQCGLLERCKSTGTALIVRTPLCFGFLTGKYSVDQPFPDGDHRNKWSRAQISAWARAREAFQQVHQGYLGMSAAQFALSYCLAYSAVATTIPGMLNEDQVRDNAAAGTIDLLDMSALQTIEEVYRQHDFVARQV